MIPENIEVVTMHPTELKEGYMVVNLGIVREVDEYHDAFVIKFKSSDNLVTRNPKFRSLLVKSQEGKPIIFT